MFNDKNLTTEKFQIAICAATSIAFAGIAGLIAIQKKIQDSKTMHYQNNSKSLIEIAEEL